MTARFILASILALLCTGCAGTLQASEGPPAVDGELIVKFESGQDIQARINDAMRDPSAKADTHSEIRHYVSELSDQVGVPLVMVRITSGRELLLAIPRRPFLEGVAERIRSRSDVSAIEIVHDETALSHNDKLIVTFGEGAKSLTRLIEASEAECREVAGSISATLIDEPAYDFDARRLEGNRLEISVDVRKVALDLATRLRDRPDVEYAQPNFAVRVYDDTRC